jgi:hypothetical protein
VPVVTCPKCPTKLKIPDGVSGNTKCPKCGTIFPVQAAPAFEVVDAAAPKPAAAQKPAAPAPKSAAKAPEQLEPDFEVVDDDEKPKKKKKTYDDDDDGDDDDEPRARKKRDKPKKKKKRYYDDDDDDDYDWQPRRRGGGAFAKGKVAALLLSISFWLNLGAYGVMTLYTLIAWLSANSGSSSSPSSSRGRGGGDGGGDGSVIDMIVLLPGLVGLGAWIVGVVGCSFAIAGPSKARGMAITATVFASLHLVFTGVTFSNVQEGLGSFGRSLPGLGKLGWILFASVLPALNTFLPMLFFQSKAINGDYVISILAAICEVCRLIFALLTLKAMASAAKDYAAAEKAHFSLMTAIFILGGILLFTLLMAILLKEGGFKSLSTVMNLGLATVFLMYLSYTLMMLGPALAALQTKDACDRRT